MLGNSVLTPSSYHGLGPVGWGLAAICTGMEGSVLLNDVCFFAKQTHLVLELELGKVLEGILHHLQVESNGLAHGLCAA